MCIRTRTGFTAVFLCMLCAHVAAASNPPQVNSFEVRLFGRYWRVTSYFVQDDLLQNSTEDVFFELEGLVFGNGFLYGSGDRGSDETDSRLARYTYAPGESLQLSTFLQMPSTSPNWWGPEGLTFNHSGGGYGGAQNSIVSVEWDTGQVGIIDLVSGGVSSRVSIGSAEDLTFLNGRGQFAVLRDSGTSMDITFHDAAMTATGEQFTVAPGTNGVVGLSPAFGSWLTRTAQAGEVLLAVTKANPGNAVLAYDLAGAPIGAQQNLPTLPKARIPLGGNFYMLLPAFGSVEAVAVDETNTVLFIGDETNTMIHVLTPGPPPPDLNRDGDVDTDDLLLFAACASGPNILLASDCYNTDFDGDGDADQCDFAAFQRCTSGAGNPADLNCAD